MVEVPTVEEWMSKSRMTLRASDDMQEALRLLVGESFAAIPVVDDEDIVAGILTEKDCLRTVCRWAYERIAGGKVEDHMSPLEHHLDRDMDLLAAAGEFLRCNFVALPVIEDGLLVGTITRHEVLAGIRHWHRLMEKDLERQQTAKSGHDRPSTIEAMQRTVASHTIEQLAGLFKKR